MHACVYCVYSFLGYVSLEQNNLIHIELKRNFAKQTTFIFTCPFSHIAVTCSFCERAQTECTIICYIFPSFNLFSYPFGDSYHFYSPYNITVCSHVLTASRHVYTHLYIFFGYDFNSLCSVLCLYLKSVEIGSLTSAQVL